MPGSPKSYCISNQIITLGKQIQNSKTLDNQ